MGDVLAGKALNVKGAGAMRPYLRTKNVLDGRIDLQDVLWMPMTDSEFERFSIQRDDVLLNEGQSLGLVGRCSIYRDEFGAPCAMQNQLLRFRAHTGTSPEFAAHLFRHCQATGAFSAIATQTTSVAHLGSVRFSKLSLLWPKNRKEQQAIADALTDIDNLIATLERVSAKKQAIKQGLMQQLLTGNTRLPGFTNPWRNTTAGEIGLFKGGSAFPTRYQGASSGEFPFFKVSDMNNPGNELFMSIANNYISDTQRQQMGAVVIPKDGIVFAKVGAAVFLERKRILSQASCIDNNMAALLVDGTVADTRFVHHALTNFPMSSLVATGALPSLNGRQLRAIPFKMPNDLEEQRSIATVLNDADRELDVLKRRLTKAKSMKQAMMQELLTGRTRITTEDPAA
jgi:type I restriction enzyme S subunit